MIDQFFRGMDVLGEWIFALMCLGLLLVVLLYTALLVVCLVCECFAWVLKISRRIHGFSAEEP